MLYCLLELSIYLSACAQQAAIAPKRQVLFHIELRYHHDASKRMLELFAKQHFVHMVSEFEWQVQETGHDDGDGLLVGCNQIL